MKTPTIGQRTVPGCLYLLLWLATTFSARAQAPAWQTATAAAGDVAVQASVANGSIIYLAGSFSGTATFGGTTLSTTNGRELFVAKWDSKTSRFVWALQGNGAATTGTNVAAALVYSSGYGLFVTGSFASPSLALGTAPALANTQAGTTDVFVARLTDAGSSVSVAAAIEAGGSGNDYATACTILNGNTLYVGGNTAGNINFGGSSGATLDGAGGFVADFLVGSNITVSRVVPVGNAVAGLTFANNALYATGTFGPDAAVFSTSTGTTTLTSAGGDDVFVASLNEFSLQTSWLTQAGGAGNDYGRAITVSGSSVYVAGSYGGTSATFGGTILSSAGGGHLFVSKLTDAGNAASFAWATQNTGGTSAYTSAYALATYGSSVYVAGTFGGTASFGSSTLTSAGSSDVLLAKLVDNGSSGALVWGQQAGGAGLDNATSLLRQGSTLYVSGQATTPASFGSSQLGAAAGARPGFLATLLDTAPLLTLAAPNTGTVGSTISLYGTRLGGTTAITFAGSSNNVVTSGFTVSADGTRISGVVVPAGAQTGPLNATTPLGSSNGLVSFTVLAAPNPAPAWQQVVSSAGGYIYRGVPDASGNIIVAGGFGDTLTLGKTTLIARSTEDIFIAKWSTATNSYVWALRTGGSGYCAGLAVSGASIYVAGIYADARIDFGSFTLTNTVSDGSSSDGFVAKLTDAGTSASFVWATNIGGANTEFVDALTAKGNSVYVGGTYPSTTLTVGNATLNNPTNSDKGFIAKLIDNGSTVTTGWLTDVAGIDGSTDYPYIEFYGLAVQGTTLYATALFSGTVNFGSTQLKSTGGYDIAVARISENTGSPAFTAVIQFGGSSFDVPWSLLSTPTALYVYGYTYSRAFTLGSTTLVGGSTSGFIVKLTDSGTAGLGFTWGTLLSGTGGASIFGLAASGNNLYATGDFTKTIRLGNSMLVSAGGGDGFVAKLTDAGSSASVEWGQSSGGLNSDGNNAVVVSGGKVYVGGYVMPAAAFGQLAVAGPVGAATATLATLADPLLPTVAPAAPAAARTLYPNPAHGRTTVQLPAGTSRLLLLDHLGRELRRQPVPAGASEAALDLGGLAQGLYLVRVLGSGPAATHRLQVE